MGEYSSLAEIYGKIKPLRRDVMWQVHQIDNFVAGWRDQVFVDYSL